MSSHALLWWPADCQGSVSSLSKIEDPRKPFNEYKKGDIVQARCTGFPGLFKAIILEVGGKKALDIQLQAPDFVVKGKAFETAIESDTPGVAKPSADQESNTGNTRPTQSSGVSKGTNSGSGNRSNKSSVSRNDNPSSPVPAAKPMESHEIIQTPVAVNIVQRASQQTPSDGSSRTSSVSSVKRLKLSEEETLQPEKSESFPTRKEFDQLKEEVRKLRRRIHQLEKSGVSTSSVPAPAMSPAPAAGSSTVNVNQESMQPLVPVKPSTVSTPASPPTTPTCSSSAAVSPASSSPNAFGKIPTDEELVELIQHVDKPYVATRLLLCSLFPREYIKSHSVSGKAANSKVVPKPMFDQRLYSKMVGTLKSKFPTMKTADITAKVHAVQKSLK